MRYRYLVDLRRGISVFAIFSYGIAVLGTPQCPRPSFRPTAASLKSEVIVIFDFRRTNNNNYNQQQVQRPENNSHSARCFI